jgi:ferrochelatase
VKRMIAFTQYPHYSCATTGNSMRELLAHGFTGEAIWRWGDHPRYIQTWVENIKATLDGDKDATLMFTAHSIPAQIMWDGDYYPFEIANTVYKVMEHFPDNPFRIVW